MQSIARKNTFNTFGQDCFSTYAIIDGLFRSKFYYYNNYANYCEYLQCIYFVNQFKYVGMYTHN